MVTLRWNPTPTIRERQGFSQSNAIARPLRSRTAAFRGIAQKQARALMLDFLGQAVAQNDIMGSQISQLPFLTCFKNPKNNPSFFCKLCIVGHQRQRNVIVFQCLLIILKRIISHPTITQYICLIGA